jgi:hypothetical protein
MADFVPTRRQMFLLTQVALHVAVKIDCFATGDLLTDLATSIDIQELMTAGFLIYIRGERVFRCTREARMWVFAHKSYIAAARPTFGGGH